MKHLLNVNHKAHLMSHPARGAWIETRDKPYDDLGEVVAPREGCVD